MTPVLIQKLSTLILLLQQLVTQLGQVPPAITPPLELDFGRRASNGSTASIQSPAPIIVPIIPTIAKVEPTKGGVGTKVKIVGEGFTPKGNIVYTGVGQVVVSSSDGQTLSFTLPRPKFLSEKWLSATADYRRQYYPEISFPLGFYVKNKNGTTVDPGLFSLTI